VAINTLHSGRSLTTVQHILTTRPSLPPPSTSTVLRCYLERKYIEYRAVDQTIKYPPFPSCRRTVNSHLDRVVSSLHSTEIYKIDARRNARGARRSYKSYRQKFPRYRNSVSVGKTPRMWWELRSYARSYSLVPTGNSSSEHRQ